MEPCTLVGLPSSIAADRAAASGYGTKMVPANSPTLLTSDVRRDRVVLEIENNTVVNAYFG